MTTRLAEFQIDGLFGLYSYRIPLNLSERVTIIIGPNGRGKTVCLKLIEALFRKNYRYFNEIPFRSAKFIFSTGEEITVETIDAPSKQVTEITSDRSTRFTLSAPKRDPVDWTPAIGDRGMSRELRRYIPEQWQQVDFDLWVDESDGEELSLSELTERHPVPDKLKLTLQQGWPDSFSNLLKEIDCHLIETQRLLVLPGLNAEGEADPSFYMRGRRRPRVSRLAIQQKAEKLKIILKDTLTRYANLSQSLDRSFPLRVFEAQGSAILSESELREELKKLDERREALMQAGILDTSYDAVTLRDGDIESGVAMALEIYVKHSAQKLDVFNNLRARLDLFKDLIKTRFIDKSLQIDRESGFKIISNTGRDVPLEKLSSGEQHQLILVFDLLFEVRENSFILIDEPELSLHVAWQKTFIESLSKIIELNAFDVLLATHSPALVARHFGLTVELGPVDD